KDEAERSLKNEENNFMLNTSYGEETIEELTVAVMLMALIQPADGNAKTVPSYNAKAASEDGRVDILTKNAVYGGNGNKNVGTQSMNQVFNVGNGNDYRNQIIQEQMLLAIKDEAERSLKNEENNFMLNTSYCEETIEELTVAVMLMALIQPADGNAKIVPSYNAKAVSEVIQLVFWIVDSRCSKYVTGNLQLLRNFVEKFMGTVRFGIDHFAAITGYGDYVQDNLTIYHCLIEDEDYCQETAVSLYIGFGYTFEVTSINAKDSAEDAGKKASEVDVGEASDNGGQDNQVSRSEDGGLFQQDKQTKHNNSTNDINTISSPVSTAGPSFVNASSQIPLNVVGPFPSTNAFEEHSFE
nr:integrase, catalytic region, zinc finger, CCHC-type, peptidase aspartic, catalytic [Tanacetum cinerariifolium]